METGLKMLGVMVDNVDITEGNEHFGNPYPEGVGKLADKQGEDLKVHQMNSKVQ